MLEEMVAVTAELKNADGKRLRKTAPQTDININSTPQQRHGKSEMFDFISNSLQN